MVGAALSCFTLVGCSALLCDNDDVTERLSPDGKWKIVGFQRTCGAHYHDNLQLSVLPANAKLPNEPGNVFSGEYRSSGFLANYEWVDNQTLQIEYSRSAGSWINPDGKVGPITIRFVERQPWKKK